MDVKVGWNTPYGEDKFDVLVEEVDVKRMLDEHGIPAERAEALTATTVFRLMWLEAEYFSNVALATRLKTHEKPEVRKKGEEAAQEAGRKKSARDTLLDRIAQGVEK